MSSQEKLEGIKDQMISDNEARYGTEIRRKYGDDTVNASYAKLRGMTEEKLQRAEALRTAMEETLAKAFAEGNPAGELAWQVCEMHKEWLEIFWPEGLYSRQAHMGLADMYVADDRFRANYDKIAPGCTEFLQKAIYHYCGKSGAGELC